MTPRHSSLSRGASEPGTADREAARLRWFLVAHVLAVLVIYAVALVVGGGAASVPFPPDLPANATRPAATPSRSLQPALKPALAEPRAALVLPTAAPDLAAPWAQDVAATGSAR